MSYPILMALTAAALVSGCGGTEPLSAITTATPQLSLPVVDTTLANVTRFSQVTATASDGIKLTLNLPFGHSVLAPAGGIISAVDNTLGAAVVYIYHSPHLTTRISQLQSLNVLAGSIALAGSSLGTSATSGAPVHFTVFSNGAIVCPQSYFTAAAQALLVNKAGNFALCD